MRVGKFASWMLSTLPSHINLIRSKNINGYIQLIIFLSRDACVAINKFIYLKLNVKKKKPVIFPMTPPHKTKIIVIKFMAKSFYL